MSKSIKKVLVTSASLLMMASIGVGAGAGATENISMPVHASTSMNAYQYGVQNYEKKGMTSSQAIKAEQRWAKSHDLSLASVKQSTITIPSHSERREAQQSDAEGDRVIKQHEILMDEEGGMTHAQAVKQVETEAKDSDDNLSDKQIHALSVRDNKELHHEDAQLRRAEHAKKHNHRRTHRTHARRHVTRKYRRHAKRNMKKRRAKKIARRNHRRSNRYARRHLKRHARR